MDSDNRFKEVKIGTVLGIYTLFIILYLISALIISTFIKNSFESDFNNDYIDIIGIIMSIFVSMTIISMFKPTRKAVKFLYDDFKLKIKFKEICKVIGVIICLIVGGKGLIIAISYYFSPNFVSLILKDSYFEFGKAKHYIIFNIVCYIISPIVDELTFRSVLFKRLSKRTHSVYIGMIVSSIIYGIIGDTSEIVGTILLGIINCILYIKYKNILIPILINYVNNIVGLIFIDNFLAKAINLTSESIGRCLEIGTVIFSIGIFLFIKFIKNNKIYLKNEFCYFEEC